jgi:hypothetical protein
MRLVPYVGKGSFIVDVVINLYLVYGKLVISCGCIDKVFIQSEKATKNTKLTREDFIYGKM